MAPTRKSRSRNPRRNVKHLVRSIHRVELGVQLTPPIDPPSWASAPWWPLTVTATASKAGSYTTNTIYLLTLKCLTLDGYKSTSNTLLPLRFRYSEVRIWGLARQPITLCVPRLNSIGTRVKQLNDRGSAINFSRLGWRYGLDSELAVDCTDTDEVFSIDGDISDNNKVLIYIRLLFQIATIPGAARSVSVPDSVPSPLGEMVQGFVNL